jgi:uncharacterized membrane protein YphA (DoxX/SURF4 family)
MEKSKLMFYGGWVLKILAGLAFLAAGGSKLAGVEDMVAVFDQIGFGQWFRYVTGIIEVVGAVLLFLPGRAVYGAGLLICTMIGAVLTHLFLIGGSPVPALVLLIICAVIAWMHREQMSGIA